MSDPIPIPDLPRAALPPPASFVQMAGDLGIEFDPGEIERLGLFLAHLLEVTRSINLTAIRDADVAWDRHIYDSLTLLPFLADLPQDARVLDVGSGGGLPGVPLAICLSTLQFTLLEATGKKARFLRASVSALGLQNVTVLQERAETAAAADGPGAVGNSRELRDAFDVVTARAVGPLCVCAELTIPFARVGGSVLLIKGERADEELTDARQALHLLHAAHIGTTSTTTGRVVVLEKRRPTPRAYPRRDGTPRQAPLGRSK